MDRIQLFARTYFCKLLSELYVCEYVSDIADFLIFCPITFNYTDTAGRYRLLLLRSDDLFNVQITVQLFPPLL